MIRWPSGGKPYTFANLKAEIADNGVKIGCISEDLFYILYKSSIYETYAYFFDTSGEKIIDLSSEIVNYHIYEIEDFSCGTAKLHFRGADNKYYTAYIDVAGELTGEPIADE